MMLALIVCAVIVVVGAIDWVYYRRDNRRVLLLEVLGFAVVLLLSLRPDWFNGLASRFGIGRGVDLIIYPMLIWLFREAIVGRVRHRKQRAEITQLARAIAVNDKITLGGPTA